MKKSIFYISLLVWITSCQLSSKSDKKGNFYIPKEARGFQIDTQNHHYILRVSNPWQGASNVEYTYYIGNYGHKTKSPDSISLPVRRVVCMSTSHSSFIESLHQEKTIVGMSGKYCYSKFLQDNLQNGQIQDIGNDYHLNIEKLLSLRPDVVFVYGVDSEFQSLAKQLRGFGLKLIYIGDYLEETPLGKAEWRIVFSLFYNQVSSAIQYHTQLSDRYQSLKKKVTNVTYKPKVMLNTPFNDVWYLPGSQNYISHYIKDAGAEFVYTPKKQRDSYPIPYESAIIQARKADFWFNVGIFTSLNQLTAQLPRFRNIPAVKECKVYNNNKRRTIQGGSDFWESGAVCPDIILQDLIQIFHPEKLNKDTLHYYHRLR